MGARVESRAGRVLLLCLLCVMPRADFVFLDLPVGFLGLDRGDALKDSVHFLESGVVHVLFYQYILKLLGLPQPSLLARFPNLANDAISSVSWKNCISPII